MPTRLGIVSDTHGHVPFSLDAVRMLESLDVDAVVHCGDIGSSAIPPLFRAWPTHYVLGNIDPPGLELQEAIAAAGHTYHGVFGSIEIEGVPIAFLHGDDLTLLNQEIGNGRWGLVCHGHTHRASLTRRGSTWVLNPGAIYRARPRSLAIVDLPALKIETIPLS